MRGCAVIGLDIVQADTRQADDIVSAKATRALAGSLVIGTLFWFAALALVF